MSKLSSLLVIGLILSTVSGFSENAAALGAKAKYKSEIVKFVVNDRSECVALPAPPNWGSVIGAPSGIKYSRGWYFTITKEVTRLAWKEMASGAIIDRKVEVVSIESETLSGKKFDVESNVLAYCEFERSKYPVGATFYPKGE